MAPGVLPAALVTGNQLSLMKGGVSNSFGPYALPSALTTALSESLRPACSPKQPTRE